MRLDFEIKELTAARAQAAFLSGEFTCADLARAYLERIGKYDKAKPAINSVIMVNPKAQAEAAAIDKRIAAGETGESLGPLFGIPVLLKDNCETKDMPTTAGSKSLEGWQTGRDAFIVEKLRNAGAIILAKVNLHEFAVWGETVSSILGQTYNPYDYTRTPGGSSGGTGAALAANFAIAGIGTDTINSIRSPASACSLCGIRPTIGLVSRFGIVPYSMTQDTAGPIARTVEDAVRILDVIVGFDENDSVTATCKGKHPQSYLPHLTAERLPEKRIGILKSFFGNKEENAPVNKVASAALYAFAEAGARLVLLEDRIDSAGLVKDVSVHLHDLKTHLNEYLASFGGKAPVQNLDDILRSGKYTPDIEENLKTASALGVDAPDYAGRIEKRKALQAQILKILSENKLDAIVYPHQQQLVCKAGSAQIQRNGALASITGYPSIAVPAGFTPPDENAPLGVPVGIEFMGAPFDEANLIEIAYAFETATHARRTPYLPFSKSGAAIKAICE